MATLSELLGENLSIYDNTVNALEDQFNTNEISSPKWDLNVGKQ